MRFPSIKSSGIKVAPAIIFFLLIAGSANSLAQWSTSSYLNTPVCTAPGSKYNPVIAPDGSSGAIIAWVDSRTGSEIYAQRMDGGGAARWPANGIIISASGNFAGQPAIIPDGSGGAIVAWADLRNGVDFNIYAQRVNGSGVVQWTAGGVLICGAGGDQTLPTLTSDGNGGAIFTWRDERGNDPQNYNLFAQGINSNGSIKWANEVIVCSAPESQVEPAIVSDGSGGAIITWLDARNQLDGTSASDIYAQRINALGDAVWPTDGISVCLAFRIQENPVIVSDGSGGAIIAWNDERNLDNAYPYNSDIFAQRINSNGAAQWTANGIGISTTKEKQFRAVITTDQAGGAIIAWQNWTGFVNYIYTRHVSAGGTALWTVNGIPIGSAGKENPQIVSDGSGGVFLSWQDFRSSVSDIYAQHLATNGNELWIFGGLAVSSAFAVQESQQIVYDNNGGIIVAWKDYRNTQIDIYGQHLQSNGALGGGITTDDKTLPFKPEVTVFPNPVVHDLTINVSSVSPKTPVEVSLIDLTGRILETKTGDSEIKFNLDSYRPSSYILSIRYDGHTVTRTVIKE